ncbi:hypothetical protein [Streptomyces meridianus]|uniref:Uncharacterized protein n=1 Tax=Streptomyces meridianus TaxID=2938945 RepID=A0ABT0X4U9_9ACTN|nr:hypothetical protein [Streptomyces meridianus]MCM2577558.1 hypothetical protein [Streptomyces meridianus]
MPLPPSEDAVTEAISSATEAVIELREALTAARVTLPSLSIDLVSCTSLLEPRPLVDLGRCNLDTTRALATALRKGAPR